MMSSTSELPKDSTWGRTSPINEDKNEVKESTQPIDGYTFECGDIEVAKEILKDFQNATVGMSIDEAEDHFSLLVKRLFGDSTCDEKERMCCEIAAIYITRAEWSSTKAAELRENNPKLSGKNALSKARTEFDAKWIEHQIAFSNQLKAKKQALIRESELKRRKEAAEEFTKATKDLSYQISNPARDSYLEKLERVNKEMENFYEGVKHNSNPHSGAFSCNSCSKICGSRTLVVVPVTIFPNQIVKGDNSRGSEERVPVDGFPDVKKYVKVGTPIWGPHKEAMHKDYCVQCDSNIPSLEEHECKGKSSFKKSVCNNCGQNVVIQEHLKDKPECRLRGGVKQ